MATWFAAPFTLDPRGRSARADADDHVRDLIRAVLFTEPGERVNRPDFGCALKTLVWSPNRDALAGATRTLAHGALQRWLEREIVVQDVTVVAVDSTLSVTVRYTRRDTGSDHLDTFQFTGARP